MTPLKKIQICLILNILLLLFISLCTIIFAADSKYFRIGPHDNFLLISVQINTKLRYYFLLILIACNNCIKVLIQELGEPVLVFNVYNPDKKIITDFTKPQLLFYANSMFFIGNTRRIFELMITITQIDIAIFSIIIEQLMSICTVCFLVSEKKFMKDKNIHNKNNIIDNITDKSTLITKN